MSKKMGFYVLRSSDTDQERSALLPIIDVAAVLICCEGRILTGFNPKWGAFTLPTTKRRSWADDSIAPGAVREEEWTHAAVRAAAEWLGRTLLEVPVSLGEVPEFQQSDRDGKWKRYRLHAYRLDLECEPAISPLHIVEWLEPEQIMDEKRMPVSPTARHVVAHLQHENRV